MTLIAVLRCEVEGLPGVVICADSQETVGDYRVTVDKISPRDAGNYDLIIGGAGNTASLIDGQAEAIERNVKRWPSGLSEDDGKRRIERILLAYHSRQVALYAADNQEKQIRLVVCVKDKTSSRIDLWQTDGTTIETVKEYALLGWEDVAYHYQVKWLYCPGIDAAQAVLLGANLFTVAKNSLYIGEPIQVIVVNNSGMHVEQPDDVKELLSRVETLNRALSDLVLACPDTSISTNEFQERVAIFTGEATRLHADYIEAALQTGLQRGWPDDPYLKYPMRELGLFTQKHLGKTEGDAVNHRTAVKAVTALFNHFIGPEKTPERVSRARKITEDFMKYLEEEGGPFST